MSDFTIHHTEQFEFGITGSAVFDPDPQPYDGDLVGQIAYLNSGRYTLGTEEVSRDRMDEIAQGIRSGELIGLPIYAYVHGGATIRASTSNNPFDCPWDSGMSGFVYTTKDRARKLMGDDADNQEKVVEALRGEVELFDAYLTGFVFGYVVERADGELLDSCWGWYGLEDADGNCLEAMRDSALRQVEEVKERRRTRWLQAMREARERRFWARRGVLTVGA